ncbi:hypothetical protein P8631_09045 [Guyparkeria sp. 1SP6A2]|nr:hypothetical protein [Guyparkeria sp. 1SP6A2]
MDALNKGKGGRAVGTPAAMSTLAICLILAVGPAAANEADNVRELRSELEQLKQRYVDEVRRLREIDARLMAVQTRLSESGVETDVAGNTALSPPVAEQVAESDVPRTAPTAEDRKQATRRSVDDFLQQEHVAFDRPLVIEGGFEYSRYDRTQLTLNGFLALDAIFLGNIAVDNVASDTFKYTLAARYGLTPRWNIGVSAPFIQRYTTYQKGGAGGSAAAIAEIDQTSDVAIGDTTFNASYRLFPETASRPDVVVTGSVIAPTGREPYGIDWDVIERDKDEGFVRFAVPEEQATGNGLWGVGASVSAVKTLDPALLFANFGYTHYIPRDFDDLNNDPDTVTPGEVKLGDSWHWGLGLAFALNDRASLSMSFSQQISGQAETKADGESWESLIGSDSNAATFNLGLTYALTKKATLVTTLGVGLTPDAPDFTLGIRVPYAL